MHFLQTPQKDDLPAKFDIRVTCLDKDVYRSLPERWEYPGFATGGLGHGGAASAGKGGSAACPQWALIVIYPKIRFCAIRFCGDTKPVIIPCHHGSATFYLGHEHSGVRGMVLQSLKTITRDPLLMHESHSPMKAGYLTSPEAAAKGQSAGEITTAPRFTASPSRLCMAYLGHRFILHTCSCHLKPPRISDLLPSRGI